jgi:hypothetical protein
MTVGAGLAVATGWHKAKDHVISRCDASDSFAYLHHNARTFVATDQWCHPWKVAGAAVIIGMTHARSCEFNKHLTSLWGIQRDGLNTPWLALFPKNCGLSLH